MTTTIHIEDGCLLCAVRALTEGEPRTWWPEETGASVQGIVLRLGTVPQPILGRPVPFVDLWLGGTDRVRVVCLGAHLERQIEMASPQVGDALTVIYEGKHDITSGKHRGLQYRKFAATVKRGHH
jgi:hypothetical protein